MIQPNNNIRQAFTNIKIIHIVMFTGNILFLFVVLLMQEFRVPEISDSFSTLFIANIALFTSIPIGFFITRKKLEQIDQSMDTPQKLVVYQTASIIKWAVINGIIMFSIVILLVEPDGKQLILAVLGFFLFLSQRPTRDDIRVKLSLSDEEYRKLSE